jgi:phosphatidylinositol alpha-1,6-mannosyltransferase
MASLAEQRNCRLTVLSLLETNADRPVQLEPATFRAYSGSRTSFALSLLRMSLKRPIVCFDHVTLATPLLPLAASGLVKTVIFAHGSEAGLRMRPSSRLSFRCAALTVTNSKITLRNMRARLPGLRGVACPLGLSPDFPLQTAPNLEPAPEMESQAADGHPYRLGGRVLLLVGRLDPTEGQKGHAILVHVLPRLLKEFPGVQLVFPGPGEGRTAIQDWARRQRVAHAVFLPGRVSQQTLNALYRRCYALVMPSKQEGFGLVYLEAMSCAKPCVGCFDDGAEEIIVPEQTGLLVRDPNNEEEVLGVLRRLLTDPRRAESYGRNGLKRLTEQFTSRHHQERVRACLDKVLG